MEVKTFYKTQIEVADTLNRIIDSYWNDEIKEATLMDLLKKVSENNKHLLYKDGEYTSVVKLKCGKRRLELVTKIFDTSK